MMCVVVGEEREREREGEREGGRRSGGQRVNMFTAISENEKGERHRWRETEREREREGRKTQFSVKFAFTLV